MLLDEPYLAEDLQGEDKLAIRSIYSLGSRTRHVLLNRITDEVKASLAKESVLSSVVHRMVVIPERPAILRVRVIFTKRNAHVSNMPKPPAPVCGSSDTSHTHNSLYIVQPKKYHQPSHQTEPANTSRASALNSPGQND
jgi:hypothetical protein